MNSLFMKFIAFPQFFVDTNAAEPEMSFQSRIKDNLDHGNQAHLGFSIFVSENDCILGVS